MKPLLVGVTLLSTAAAAQVCSQSQLNGDLQLFRRWSLDLRGRAPAPAELDAIVAHGGLAGSELDALLGSPELKAVERERLRHDVYGALDVMWSNGFGLARTTTAFNLPDSRDVFWIRLRPGRQVCDVSTEQTRFDADGVPTPDAVGRVGWKWAKPYWAPGTRIKVCALDAQEHALGPKSGADCSSSLSILQHGGAADCGCGPNLQWCQLDVAYASAGVFYEATTLTLNRAFAEQTMRFVDRLLDEHLPWSNLLLDDVTFVNGPIAHYLRYQTGTTTGNENSARPSMGYVLPALQWADTAQWQKVTVTGRSAGLLTQPHWLLKFPTNRARANRFYNAFLCSAFQAPPEGLPAAGEPCTQNPNLSQRCGCKYCHEKLEPMAGYWGLFAERGSHELLPGEFPRVDSSCDGTNGPVSFRCQTYYFTKARVPAEQPYVGKLRAYLFSDGYESHLDDGPRTLALDAVQRGDFARCTVRKEFERLVGRPFQENLSDERAQLEALAHDFQQSNHDLRALMRALVTSEQYRHVEGAMP